MYYKKHLFVCTHQKLSTGKCCAQDGERLFEELKGSLKKQNMHGAGLYRVSKSGCLGRCEMGPNVVVYPESRWFHAETAKNILSEVQKDNTEE